MKRAFFAVYAVVLFVHMAKQIPTLPVIVVASALAGVALSLIAHRVSGILAFILIAAHIAMETHEHALHWHTYSSLTILLVVAHSLLDGIFLWFTTKEVFPGKERRAFVAAMLAWSTGACVSWKESVHLSFADTPHHEHSPTPGLGFLYGGMLGCALVHVRAEKNKTGP
jgi:hypothetical protein